MANHLLTLADLYSRSPVFSMTGQLRYAKLETFPYGYLPILANLDVMACKDSYSEYERLAWYLCCTWYKDEFEGRHEELNAPDDGPGSSVKKTKSSYSYRHLISQQQESRDSFNTNKSHGMVDIHQIVVWWNLKLPPMHDLCFILMVCSVHLLHCFGLLVHWTDPDQSSVQMVRTVRRHARCSLLYILHGCYSVLRWKPPLLISRY